MHHDRLQSLPQRLVALDTETYRIRRGFIVPDLVCGSAGWLETGPRIQGAFLDKQATLELFAQLLEDPNAIIGGANVAFDLAVLANELAKRGIDAFPAIFKALEQGRVYDLQIAEALHAIAEGCLGRDPRTGGELKNPETGKRGRYSLSICVDLVLGRQDAKANDDYRLRYGELDGIPIAEWPQAARDYPIDDAKNTQEVCLAQTGHLPKTQPKHRFDDVNGVNVCTDCGATRFSTSCVTRKPHRNLHQVADQVWSAFGLHLGAAWGFRVDQDAVSLIEDYYTRKRDAAIEPFVTGGLVWKDKNGDYHEYQSVVKKRVALAYGSTEPCPHCNGTGEIPKREQRTLRCPDCKGRCVPWKAGGKVKDPTVASCATCANTGRVAHPVIDMRCCAIYGVDEAGKETKTITCDGTGLVLVEDVPRSDAEGIGKGRDALGESGDEFLMNYGWYKEDQKILTVYVPFFRTAREPVVGHRPECETLVDGKKKPICRCPGPYRDIPLTLMPNAVLETGRVSYGGATMLLPRKPGFIDKDENSPTYGKYIPSLRECVVPRGPRYEVVEVSDDYVLQPGEVFAC